MNNSSLVKFEVDGNAVLVRDTPDKNESAKLLSELINKMYALKKFVVENIDNYPEYKDYINQFNENFNKNRTKIYETSLNSEYTSYSINKGEELVFCLRSKSTGKLHDINLLMYVAVHELAHTACPETGHTPLFNKIFKFLLEIAIDTKVYYYEDYASNPIEYCGMKLYTNILN
uniref:WLM domain-containing protein n=1 Tax=viral metagenome TaxID=1070528 RepID=A0A6C0HUY6_9ZZZZ